MAKMEYSYIRKPLHSIRHFIMHLKLIKYSYPFSALFLSISIVTIPFSANSTENITKNQQIQEVRPFNNMLRSMILLADEVLSDTKSKPSGSSNQDNATSSQTQPAVQGNSVNTTPPANTQTVPATGQSSSAPSNPNTPATGTDTKPNNEVKKEAKTPPQELPKVEMPNPEVPEVKSLPTTSVTSPKDGEPGLFGKIFNSSPQEKPVPTVTPGQGVKPKKKKHVEPPKPIEPPPPEPLVGALKPGENPIPNARPDTNYKTQILPGSISKKTYARENEHLPPAVYNEEYKKILFDSAATGDLNLLRTMVDNFKDTEVRDSDGNTPLIYSVMAGNLESVISVISMGARVNARNHNGISPLYAATKLGRIDLVIYILERTQEPDITDKNDKTPLMLAAEMDLSRITNLLIKSGADINRKMRNGDTPIHLAASSNSVVVMSILLAKGADIEKRNFKGYTPLMIAVEEGHDKAVALLLTAGADISKTNIQGMDVFSIAKNSANNSTMQLLESEKIKRDMLAEKLLQTRKTQIISDAIEPVTDNIVSKAIRLNGVPLPIFKIKHIPEAKTKIKAKKISKTKLKKKQPPKPYFSPEEMNKMKKRGG